MGSERHQNEYRETQSSPGSSLTKWVDRNTSSGSKGSHILQVILMGQLKL